MRIRMTAATAAFLALAPGVAIAQASAPSAASCARLEKDERRASDPMIELALASCYGLAGRTGSALLSARRAAEALAAAGDSRADQARLMEAQFEARAPRLRIIVSRMVSGMQVRRNGELVPATDWGIDVPVDPGVVQVDASAPGHGAWSGRIALEGGQKTLEIPGLQPVSSTAVPGPVGRPEPGTSRAHTAALVSGAAGLATIGVGAAFGIMSMIAHDEADRHCNRGPSQDLCDREGLHQNQLAMKRGDVATGAFVTGGALLGLGLALWFGAPQPERPAAAGAIRLVPRGFAGGGGAEVRGTF